MTGIERLRSYARSMDELSVWPVGMNLLDVADQIERELRDERDRWESDLYEAQVAWNRVMGVCLEMERHCLYHEDTTALDAARWARELRHALRSDASDVADGQEPGFDGAADPAGVTSEAQEVTDEDREAVAWVRDHGGLERVRAEWRSRVPYDSASDEEARFKIRFCPMCGRKLRERGE